MPDGTAARQWKIIALTTAAGGVTLMVIGLAFLFAFDQPVVGSVLTGVGGIDLVVAGWFARRAAGEG